MADYPTSVYAPRTKANRSGVVYTVAKSTVAYAEDITKLDAEVVAIETDLLQKNGITTITSHATPTIDTDECGFVTITALAEAITSMTTNLSGTPTNFQKLIFRIKDNGTARAITWGAKFVAKGVALPITTVLSKLLTVGFIYDTVAETWGCVAVANEA